jgi:hypothetical protein
MLDKAANRVVRFLSGRAKSTMGKVLFCFTCLERPRKNIFGEKNFQNSFLGKI